jgi:hypothetical protein
MKLLIPIDEDIKEQLRTLKIKLETELKEKITYNEVIKYLLQNDSIFPNKSRLKSLRGVISYNSAQKSLEESKRLSIERQKNYSKI